MNTQEQTDRFGVIAESSCGCYRIAEIVTPQGHYITHPELFETADAAYSQIRELKRKEARQ